MMMKTMKILKMMMKRKTLRGSQNPNLKKHQRQGLRRKPRLRRKHLRIKKPNQKKVRRKEKRINAPVVENSEKMLTS
jgi:hypothetical protein